MACAGPPGSSQASAAGAAARSARKTSQRLIAMTERGPEASASSLRREERLAVLVCDARGALARQVGEPLARPARVLGDVIPALRREGVGPHHEPVGEFEERLAPFGVHLAARAVVGAEREVAPEILVLAQQVAHVLRPVES